MSLLSATVGFSSYLIPAYLSFSGPYKWWMMLAVFFSCCVYYFIDLPYPIEVRYFNKPVGNYYDEGFVLFFTIPFIDFLLRLSYPYGIWIDRPKGKERPEDIYRREARVRINKDDSNVRILAPIRNFTKRDALVISIIRYFWELLFTGPEIYKFKRVGRLLLLLSFLGGFGATKFASEPVAAPLPLPNPTNNSSSPEVPPLLDVQFSTTSSEVVELNAPLASEPPNALTETQPVTQGIPAIPQSAAPSLGPQLAQIDYSPSDEIRVWNENECARIPPDTVFAFKMNTWPKRAANMRQALSYADIRNGQGGEPSYNTIPWQDVGSYWNAIDPNYPLRWESYPGRVGYVCF
ncbi:MAG: hypothetical protein JWN37_790 [Candidatus Nomurabacteria bacterium]|nr:hypothetical protein [Candidatus Nomurabacteria bacterium]